jgi:tetratricopeptide (TPR) repeat protein
MVIGSFILRRKVRGVVLLGLALLLPAVRLIADDQIIKRDGTVLSGEIEGASDGQVTVQIISPGGGVAKFPIAISDIKSITMAVPEGYTAAQAPGATPAAVIAALEPLVKQYAGLPADWVVGAMTQLAEAYSAQGHSDLALATYNQILQLYAGTVYINAAKAGIAEMNLKAGKVEEALTTVLPIVAKANQDIAPSPSDGALYAKAFLVYGEVLEKQSRLPEALEAYLTVKTMFYQNPSLADQADRLAKNLRSQNPTLGVE